MRLEILLPENFTNHPQGGLSVEGICTDHRQTEPGFLFIALSGSRFDGREFIAEAFAQGAVVVITERQASGIDTQLGQKPIIHVADIRLHLSEMARRFYSIPEMPLVAVTGTNGKTSTTHYLAQVCDALQQQTALIGTNGNGFLSSLSASSHTTPDLFSVYRLLTNFVLQGAKQVAMEVSSHALDQGRVEGVPYTEAVFTNLTHDHLDYHGTMARYAAAKAKLFTEFSIQRAIINLDDPFAEALLAQLPSGVEAIGYGFTTRAGINCLRADNFVASAAGFSVDLAFEGQRTELKSPLLGRFNLSNLLAVGAVLLGRGQPLDQVSNLLGDVESVMGRMQAFRQSQMPLVVVDYAHTPDALEKALLALREHAQARLHVIFGCGGDRDRGKRAMMARVAEEYADRVIVSSDNPRREDPTAIVEEIMAGFSRPDQVEVEPNRALAIRQAVAKASIDDVVLVAGKGHEAYQEIMGIRHPFSDIEQVQALMRGTV